MQAILYGGQYTWKTTVWKNIHIVSWDSFIDLDDYIVEYKLGKPVAEYVSTHPEWIDAWWKAFRDFEFESLGEVLEEWYDVISLWGGTMAFERNRNLLSHFDTLKVFLSVDVKSQVDRYLEKSASGNENRLLEVGVDKQREKFQEMYDARHEIYKDNADIVFDTVTDDIKNVTWWILDELDYNAQISILRKQIDKIDDQLIDIIKKSEGGITSYNDLLSHTSWSRILKERKQVVKEVGKLKKKYNKECRDKERQEIVRVKWEDELPGIWAMIYDDIHEKAIEIEEECE